MLDLGAPGPEEEEAGEGEDKRILPTYVRKGAGRYPGIEL